VLLHEPECVRFAILIGALEETVPIDVMAHSMDQDVSKKALAVHPVKNPASPYGA
jgi:hypothetical protein